MCGIAGVSRAGRREASADALAAMVAAQHHRGPDDHGIEVLGPIGLGHDRLSIVDLSHAGHQPFSSPAGSLSFNGEIFNCRVLGRELEDLGVTFRGTSDTEVLFNLLVRFGPDETLARISGMYAFAWVEAGSDSVVLARDPRGIKPLLYAERNGDLWFASEIAGLRAVVDVQPDPVRTLFSLLGRAEATGWQSVFSGVSQVPPGEYVVVSDGAVQKSVVHHGLADVVDPEYYGELDGCTPDAAAEELVRLLRASTELRLLSDAPMGSMVSGGVDSALTAVLAAPNDPDHRLFTADVVGLHSERRAAEELARFVDRRLYVDEFQPGHLLDEWAAATLSHESPLIAHVNSVPFQRVAKCAADAGVKAVLTGEGADELFLGYPLMLLDTYGAALAAPVRAMRRLYGLVPGLVDKLLPTRGTGQPAFLAELVEDDTAARNHASGMEAFSFLPPHLARRQVITYSYVREHLQTLLHRNDRMGMSAGIEARFPYLDDRMVRFGLNLPYRHKVRMTTDPGSFRPPFLLQKAVIRGAADRLLPESLAGRPKAGFPMHGHVDVVATPEFFADGYVAEIGGLSAEGMTRVVEDGPSYYVAKLVSIEVFGALFARDQSVEQVTERIQRHLRMAPASTSRVPVGVSRAI